MLVLAGIYFPALGTRQKKSINKSILSIGLSIMKFFRVPKNCNLMLSMSVTQVNRDTKLIMKCIIGKLSNLEICQVLMDYKFILSLSVIQANETTDTNVQRIIGKL